ncbi:mitochondrial tRNA methylthiotransferase CDK5RAP1-like isoform X5 [Ptychodera flava]|uniref:mitochondrial tRNA methylthiotransferase CDK5RAP1-like isoform X1 n=1 Tax=Ptychodera flava TaxID=63121 RepID=UPI00396A2297
MASSTRAIGIVYITGKRSLFPLFSGKKAANRNFSVQEAFGKKVTCVNNINFTSLSGFPSQRNLSLSSASAHPSESSTSTSAASNLHFSNKLKNGPPLEHFIANSNLKNDLPLKRHTEQEHVPYIQKEIVAGNGRKVYFETYGCQMNESDTEIAWSILQNSGFLKTADVHEADVIFAVTCAVRENAETKVWNRLKYFQALKRKRSKSQTQIKIGLLGCMAERLKKEILEKSKAVDLIAGPDAYRDLPRMLAVTEHGQPAVNVILSLDETYADVIPVRMNSNSPSAFVSIMRGCDNMCSYCIVPFTRGRERSRPISSIVEEVKILSDQGVKEVTLLGQNVNSYRDTSEMNYFNNDGAVSDTSTNLSKGFKTIYKPKKGGLRFAELLDQVSDVDPEMRIRFTSPHPKDFPDEVLEIINERPNICKHLHLPAQSGNTEILKKMRRGYTREAYLELVHHVRSRIPNVALTSDFISGFCGETKRAHEDTLSLLRLVKYDFVYAFAYSMRQKTHAYHKMEDNVPYDIKVSRLTDVLEVSREEMFNANNGRVGTQQLVLVEGPSKKSADDLAGRSDFNTKVIFPNMEIPCDMESSNHRPIKVGDYVVVCINDCTSQVMKGIPLYHTTLQEFSKHQQNQPCLQDLRKINLPFLHFGYLPGVQDPVVDR